MFLVKRELSDTVNHEGLNEIDTKHDEEEISQVPNYNYRAMIKEESQDGELEQLETTTDGIVKLDNTLKDDLGNTTKYLHHDCIDEGEASGEKPSSKSCIAQSNTIKKQKTKRRRGNRRTCNTCSYKARFLSDLMRHELIHSGEKPYKCDVCDYSCNQSQNLKQHKLIHSGDKPYECEFCGYCTAKSGHLKRHKRIHLGQKPFKCDVCEYSSAQLECLKTHKLTHNQDSAEKRYKCDLCDYRTSHSGNLKTHKRARHAGEKPYTCSECDYRTSYAGSLQQHKAMHSKDRPYKCGICGYSYKGPSSLKRHMKKHAGH